ncbi:hypothetical protein PJU73_05935 [Neisseria lisongii]|uniref:Transposase n=1 Tax=Neisseria lisongii TaxID=2912188 RepID=A0ABY7RHL6_9NEIS|nr:hypothetical protein [Neisseria lisongii]WCL70903.1 hypothetical protein PJU73_05935 [Neisseria lisongii]
MIAAECRRRNDDFQTAFPALAACSLQWIRERFAAGQSPAA